ncbi:pyridoxamine 5'-phosphate oxidase family protein [Actinosynnema sp. NPDC047251]|uniref:Pyridoxamine 5'-phosphate oxidase N-terminal domain-containing protein n=1 Tax=Saccharothrix espanaensis (strain ATCC 51144 / DSM 44229 / JCM 9112 / NBRC 15066 / NRRL 15764) TaxID=1179773 RepID=K0K0G7_SACES|nr:pyridoxamine 5'-phosphate oxidase family protein [Saccharothrix espanaensis]CCH31836.1 hypothetical protein BN6_45560 [Saccharothrix espanaensis DSM 44229]
MTGHDDAAARSTALLDGARYLTLATTGDDGPWASTVNFVALRGPLRLVWYSSRSARHSRNIAAHPVVAASMFMTGLPGFGLDGAQLVGRCTALEDVTERFRRRFYELDFPDEEVRDSVALPLAEFTGDGHRRFYVLEVRQWWLLDVARWLADKEDTRFELPNAPDLR